MLIISQDQFLAELKESKSQSIQIGDKLKSEREKVSIGDNVENETPIIPNEVVLESHVYDNFRKKSVPNIPTELKPVVAALAHLDTQENVAEAFGVSKDTVGTLANDLHSNAEVSEIKESILHKIKATAETKISECVEFVKILKDMNNKDLLNTAEQLSRIHRNVSPAVAPSVNNDVKFIYYIPERQNRLEEYEIIDAVN